VEQLRAALARTESGIAADRLRHAIASGNPDLGPLRRLPDFGHFEEGVYPTLRPARPHSDRLIDSRMSAYAGALLAQGALLLEETWQQRAGPAATGDAYQLIHWLDRDLPLWRTLDRIARDRARYWRDRAEFIQLVREVVDPVRLAEAGFPPEVPRGDDAPGTGVAALDRRLDALHRAVTGPAGDGTGRVRRRLAELDLRGTPLRGDEAAQICTRQAARWQRVAERLRRDATKVGEPGYTKVARRRPVAAVPARRTPAL
jgi:hypothetical protein